MKTLSVLTTALVLLGRSLPATAQKNDSIIANAVKFHRYTFKANIAIPTGGSSRQLSGDYDLKVSKDTIVSYLPYFGRAYSAPIGGGPEGLEFTSLDFSYDEKGLKKGGWEIRIKPNDNRDIRLLLLSVSLAGYASLQVNSNNRQPITFTGMVQESEK
jgi:Domain of unknown function (DUF4251)